MRAKPHPSPDSWIGSHTSPSYMHRANFLSSSGEGLAARHLQIFDFQSLQPLPLPCMKNLIKTQAMGRVSTDSRIGWRVRCCKQSFIFLLTPQRGTIMDFTIDFSTPIGPIKPMNGVCNGPSKMTAKYFKKANDKFTLNFHWTLRALSHHQLMIPSLRVYFLDRSFIRYLGLFVFL